VSDILIVQKETTKQHTVFAGISVTRQPSGVLVLPDRGINKLYPLVCDGEDSSGWKGTSWGFIYTREKIMLSKGTLGSFYSSVNLHQFLHNSDWNLYENKHKEQQVFVEARNYKCFWHNNIPCPTLLTHLPRPLFQNTQPTGPRDSTI
jgi:hypothetical protein